MYKIRFVIGNKSNSDDVVNEGNSDSDGINIVVDEDTSILDAARKAGIAIESPCGSAGTCRKCGVKLDDASMGRIVERGGCALSGKMREDGYVLACQTFARGDISVTIPAAKNNRSLKILASGKGHDFGMETDVVKRFDRDRNVTDVLIGGELSGTEKGDTTSSVFGVVVDIGTTTLVASLVNLSTGREIACESSLNPQATIAQDVLSRIKYGSEPAGLFKLKDMLIIEINRMIGAMCGNMRIERHYIYEAVFSGNTCMLHLASGIDPAPLGKYPFTQGWTGGRIARASKIGLSISIFGLVYCPPNISAYVGADITSGILTSRLHENDDTVLFIDIGTNGEMALSVKGKICASSTAAGPAFEGMNIEYGMRAAEGAVDSFTISDGGDVTVTTIGGKPAIGICGSGLLDIAGELVRSGLVDKNGKFVDPVSGGIPDVLRERFIPHNGRTSFRISGNVVVTQKDIRQIQLAKGAIRAGIEVLIVESAVRVEDIDRVLIAGSFGYHLRVESLFNIGLLPPVLAGKVSMVGNTSKTGGHAFLMNNSIRGIMDERVKEISVIELANRKDFDRVFVKSLAF